MKANPEFVQYCWSRIVKWLLKLLGFEEEIGGQKSRLTSCSKERRA